jgi:hypothetical protein
MSSQKLWVQHQTNAKTFGPTKVSIEGCDDVDDLLKEIKKEFSKTLGSFNTSQLTLFRPDGITKINPGETIEKLNEFNVGPWTPLVVTVEEFPTPALSNDGTSFSFDWNLGVQLFSTLKMTLHFVTLKLGNKTYKSQVSYADCTYVDDFKGAIKNKNPHLLNSYDAAQLTLFQPDGITEIDPRETIL